MKSLYTWLLLVIVGAARLQAAPVDSLTVAKAATNHLSQYVDRFTGLTCAVKRTAADGTALYYVFNHKNGGYVIVAADDACFPILGYAPTGSYTPNRVPVQLDKWLFYRAGEISFIKQQKFAASDEVEQSWQRLKFPPSAARIGQVKAVAPLVTTRWDQSPYYNDLCPADTKAKQADGYKTVSGCVATAMAQLMKYHNFPKTGQGVYSYTHSRYGRLSADFSGTTYNWASMPNRVTSRNAAVATLMYHCGVSVDMDYDISANGGSGTQTAKVADALKKHFGYASSVRYVARSSYTETAWIALMKTELDAKRPIQYKGQGSEGGHSFVCDGYDNNNFLHYNWGWGGQSDGYFNINALNPGALGTGGGAGGFNQYQGAIIGIQPAVAASTTFDLQLNKRLTVSPNPIDFGSDVTVSFNITNRGTAGFQGDYAVGLFTDAGEFVSFIGEAKTGFTLSAGNRYTSDLTFTQSSLFLSEGNYIIAAYYRETQKEWQLMGKATFENAVSVPVAGVDDVLKMYATPLQTSTSPVYQGTPFSVSCNIANFGTNAFEGALSMDVYSTDGEFVANIETKENQSLTTNQTYTSALVFKTAGLAIPVGTYLLVPTYKRKANSEYYVLAAYKDAKGSYPNLIQLVVAAPVLVADRFEDNDKEPQATTLPVSFANNVATVTTESANLHLGSDIDYYKLNLPGGYSYEVTARVHDSDNTGNGKTYTTDVIFSYKSGNRAYSDVYDVSVNDANSKIIPTAGSALIFKVAPYFVGDDGTYRLDIQITRSSVVLGVDDNPVNEQVTVYPNPTTGPVTVQTPPSADFKTITVLNGMGQRVLEVNGPRTGGKTPVDLSGQPAGVYFLQLTGSGQPVTRKISVIK